MIPSMHGEPARVPSVATAPKANTDLTKELNYEKIIKLFTNRHTCELYDRQIAVINRVCRHNPNGFYIKDLPYIQQMFGFAKQNVESGMNIFVDPLCSLIKLCGKPFLRSKANEDLIMTQFIVDNLKVIGDMLFVDHIGVQLTAAQALQSIAKGKDLQRVVSKKNTAVDDLRTPPAQFYQQLLCTSGVVETAVIVLNREIEELFSFDTDGDGIISEQEMFRFRVVNDADMENDAAKYVAAKGKDEEEQDDESSTPAPYLMLTLMKALREFSTHAQNAAVITKLGGLQNMVKVLGSISDFHEQLLLVTCEVLWNVLEHCDSAVRLQGGSVMQKQVAEAFRESNSIEIICKKSTFQVLHNLLVRILSSGYRKKDKELRNELLIVSHLLSQHPPALEHFKTTGYLQTLLDFSTAPDLPPGQVAPDMAHNMHNFGTCNEEDFELKQLMWGLLGRLVESGASDENAQANLEIVGESQLVETLLMYISVPLPQGLGKWAPTQLKSLQLQALSLLCLIVPLDYAAYDGLGGSETVAQYMRVASSPDVLGNVNIDSELQNASLKVLLHTCKLKNFKTQLGEAGSIETMLDLFTDPSKPGTVRRDAISVISRMCAGGHVANQQRFRRAGGVAALRDSLGYKKEDAAKNNFMIFAVVSCIWNVVIGNRQSEARLVDIEGVDALLDLLEVCPVVMRKQLLGVLADLCKNPKASRMFRAWKSDISMKGATTLLLELWEAEEKRNGVSRTDKGLLNNLDRPLDAAKAKQVNADSDEPTDADQLTGNAPPIAGPEGGGVEEDPEASPAFARLSQALQAARELDDSEQRLKDSVEATDMRCTIFSVLASVGFDEVEDGLAIHEHMTFACARQYPEFRKGQQWLDVKGGLKAQEVAPISADFLLIESKVEEAFNIAMHTKCLQKGLLDSKVGADANDEQAFFNSILLQKEQELQQQLLMKKNKTSKSSMKSRLEAKQKKADMLKKSLQKDETMDAALAV
jgi:hypothetical protein